MCILLAAILTGDAPPLSRPLLWTKICNIFCELKFLKPSVAADGAEFCVVKL